MHVYIFNGLTWTDQEGEGAGGQEPLSPPPPPPPPRPHTLENHKLLQVSFVILVRISLEEQLDQWEVRTVRPSEVR